ncbi:hypothetical protein DITRI_Ditri15bG0039300 [Diplodiscus trichospermus]
MDWRARLHTVFVDNLSRRVSRSAIWEVFNKYGRVFDVLISRSTKGRYYKEVLVCSNPCNEEAGTGNDMRLKEHFEEHKFNDNGRDKSMEESLVKFEVNILEAEMEWLQGCIIGRLRDNMDVKWVNKKLVEDGYPCQICRLGGLSVLKFGSKDQRDLFLNEDIVWKNELFEDLQPWSKEL